jgi:hypothetical protein
VVNETENKKMDYRDYLIELVDDGLLDAREALIMLVKWMSQDDVKDVLTANEIFMGEDEFDIPVQDPTY